ncbi:MAG: BBP7 family outer membrane beta-barrel protein [Planctomycetia bacterium]
MRKRTNFLSTTAAAALFAFCPPLAAQQGLPAPAGAYPVDAVYDGPSDGESYAESSAGGCATCFDGSSRCKLYFLPEYVYMDRTVGNSVTVLVNENAGDAPVFQTNDLKFDNEAGGRFTFGLQCSETAAVELSMMGVYDHLAMATAVGNNNISIPGDLAATTQDFFAADALAIQYDADLTTIELNALAYFAPYHSSFAVIGGMRYLNLTENFAIRSVLDADTGSSTYRIGASNNMIGPQAGVRYLKECGPVVFDLFGKAGIMLNFLEQNTNLTDFNNTAVLRDFGSSDEAASFVGELGFNLGWKLNERILLRGGYRALWIDGYGAAFDQLDFGDVGDAAIPPNSDSRTVYHGANVGVQFTY